MYIYIYENTDIIFCSNIRNILQIYFIHFETSYYFEKRKKPYECNI